MDAQLKEPGRGRHASRLDGRRRMSRRGERADHAGVAGNLQMYPRGVLPMFTVVRRGFSNAIERGPTSLTLVMLSSGTVALSDRDWWLRVGR